MLASKQWAGHNSEQSSLPASHHNFHGTVHLVGYSPLDGFQLSYSNTSSNTFHRKFFTGLRSVMEARDIVMIDIKRHVMYPQT